MSTLVTRMCRLVLVGAIACSGLWWTVGCKSKTVGVPGEDGGTPGVDAGPWTPPLTNNGTPGWRESEEPWEADVCEHLHTLDLWSYEGGVFVLQDYVYVDQPDECDTYERLSFNDGTGWQDYYDRCSMGMSWEVSAIMGFPDGQLMGVGGGGSPGPVVWIDEDGTEVSANLDAQKLFIVNETLAYAIDQEKAYRFDGIGWEPVPAFFPYDVYGIWADATDLFGVGINGTIISYSGSSQEWVVHDSGTIESLSTVWGFGGSDVWVGSAESDQLLHYDGVEWTPQQWPVHPPGSHTQIEGMWGQDGVLFFHTNTQLVRWDGSQFTDLSTWPCVEEEIPSGEVVCTNGLVIMAIWGNSPTEVFIGFADASVWPFNCRELHLFWFDGTDYHWF